METLKGVITFSERVDESVLQEAQHAVLEKFGSYIPADSECYQARAEVVFGMDVGTGRIFQTGGFFHPDRNWLTLTPYHLRKTGLHMAVHEYCHCFTHLQFDDAVTNSLIFEAINESLTEHIADKIPAYGWLSKFMSRRDSIYDSEVFPNGKKVMQAAQELEEAVGEATLLRAYFSGDKAAIRKVSRAAVDIFPKMVTLGVWDAIQEVAANKDNRYIQPLGECFVGASLLSSGELPPKIPQYQRVFDFSQINAEQQKEIKNQAEQVRERLGTAFDQAFYNFDKDEAEESIKLVYEDLRTHWKSVLPNRTAADIFPKSVTRSAVDAIDKLVGNMSSEYEQQLGECFVGASLLGNGYLPLDINVLGDEELVSEISKITVQQEKEIKRQVEQVRERLGVVFDQAFYNFDKEAAEEAMKTVHEDLRANWKNVLPEEEEASSEEKVL